MWLRFIKCVRTHISGNGFKPAATAGPPIGSSLAASESRCLVALGPRPAARSPAALIVIAVTFHFRFLISNRLVAAPPSDPPQPLLPFPLRPLPRLTSRQWGLLPPPLPRVPARTGRAVLCTLTPSLLSWAHCCLHIPGTSSVFSMNLSPSCSAPWACIRLSLP